MAKSIKKNYIFNIILSISKVIFPLITAPYVARVLEPDGLGLFNFANTYAGYFGLVAALGIPIYGIREIAKCNNDLKQQEKLFSEIFSLSIISTLICVVIFVMSVLVISRLNENYLIFFTAGIVLYLTPFKIDWFFSGKEEFGYITYRSVLIKTLSVILLFSLVHDKDDLIIYVLIYALSQVVNELWNFLKLLNIGIKPFFTLNISNHLTPLLLLFSSSIAVSLYTVLDTIMLGFIKEYSEVGFYNCASSMSKVLVPIVTSMAVVAMPRLSNYHESQDWDKISCLMNKSLSLVCFLSFPLAVGIFILSPVFVPLFFGADYCGAIVPLQIIVFIIISIGLNNLLGIQLMGSLGYDKYLLTSISIGAAINIVLNCLFIPLLGAIGACISSLCAETSIVLVMLIYVYKLTPIRFGIREILLDFLAILPFFPLSISIRYIFDGWNFVFFFIITASTLYFILQLLLKNSSLLYLLKSVPFVKNIKLFKNGN